MCVCVCVKNRSKRARPRVYVYIVKGPRRVECANLQTRARMDYVRARVLFFETPRRGDGEIELSSAALDFHARVTGAEMRARDNE